jgi:ubiquinone/menaquinone biosynthesis C-methylase UbiE
MSLKKQKDDWEELANIDPLYAICSHPTKKFGQWDLEEFFQTGEEEINSLMEDIKHFDYPEEKIRSLDHGCGVGRLTRPMSKYFSEAYGVDISPTMIKNAQDLNQDYNCEFVLNDGKSLPFPDEYFDMIYSNLVLMHMPDRSIIESYVSEFIRTLKKGGLIIFQLPSGLSTQGRLQPRRLIYTFLRDLGMNSEVLYKKLNLTPIRMNFIDEMDMQRFLKTNGAEILDIERINEDNFKNRFYYLTKK